MFAAVFLSTALLTGNLVSVKSFTTSFVSQQLLQKIQDPHNGEEIPEILYNMGYKHSMLLVSKTGRVTVVINATLTEKDIQKIVSTLLYKDYDILTKDFDIWTVGKD